MKKCVTYDLSTKELCKIPKTKTASYGLQSVSLRESFLWDARDDTIKQELARFYKAKIEHWIGEQ